MRELLLVLGLISLGYLAQSSIGLALNRSCEYYEEIASARRLHVIESDRNPRFRQAQSNFGEDIIHASVESRSISEAYTVDENQFQIVPASEIREVKVTQTSTKSARAIR